MQFKRKKRKQNIHAMLPKVSRIQKKIMINRTIETQRRNETMNKQK